MKLPELLQTSYQYTYSILKRFTFEVLPLSSYVLSMMMLPLLEAFLELLLWKSLQCCHHIFWMSSLSWNIHPFKADFHFGNRQKLFGPKSMEYGGCPVSVINFWARNCLTENALWAGALLWWIIQFLSQSSGLFLHTASCNHYFHIISLVGCFDLVEWIQNQHYPWYRRQWWALSSFVILTCMLSLNCLYYSKTHFS